LYLFIDAESHMKDLGVPDFRDFLEGGCSLVEAGRTADGPLSAQGSSTGDWNMMNRAGLPLASAYSLDFGRIEADNWPDIRILGSSTNPAINATHFSTATLKGWTTLRTNQEYE
jgi:hypothetical protein